MTSRTTLSLALPVLVLAGLSAGCASSSPATQPPPPTSVAAPPSSSPAPPTGARDGSCAAAEQEMTPREQVAQLVFVGVSPSDPAAAVNLVRTEQVGGVFIGGNPTNLLRDDALAPVHQAAKWGVAVAVDEEGGRVQRIDQLDGDLPSAREMAKTMTVDQVRDTGRRRGEQMRARGITEDFAPSLDVSSQPDEGPIGDRSFSDDPARARDYGIAFADGLRQAGITPVFKHFPGHGHGEGDSHDGSVVTPPLASLRTNDLVPYTAVAGFGGGAVMVGHLTVPDLTNGQPASLSPEAYRLLRTDYHFTGLVLTDDLGAMKAITTTYKLPDAVLHALLAGADQALWSSGGDVGPVLDRLERALSTGELPRARVDEALGRVLKSKGVCD